MGSESRLPLVSIVVTVKNEERHLRALLDSLVHQEPPFEVVVVDALSRDGTLAIALEYQERNPERFRVLSHYGSRGIGRNVGVAEARCDYVAFIDGDCIADSQWLAEVREGFRAGDIVAGRTEAVGAARYGQLDRIELFREGMDVTYPSCNLGYRRALFERLQGFDPRFITAEDIDLNLRAVQMGARIHFVPTARVYHQMRDSLVQFMWQAFWNGYGRKQLTEKHGSLWGNYRFSRLLWTQHTIIASARLTAALAGYVTRVLTAGHRNLGRGPPEGEHHPEGDGRSRASSDPTSVHEP
ncbi:MAG: glycosyltransferase [Thermoplasmata archaeon]